MTVLDFTIHDASKLIAAGELSPEELVDSAITRIQEVDHEIGAFSAPTLESAREDAAQAAKEIARGNIKSPLHGIPIAVKTLVDRAGVESTSSSRTRAGRIAEVDAAVVERLQRAGAILVGQTHTHEYAYGVMTPTTRNPWHTGHTPGGSSGGSAAAVAGGMALGAIGTDTGGSIRIPSSACGLTGIKPTYGRVSRFGITSLSSSLDHAGPMARTVADNILMLQQLAGYDPRDSASIDLEVPDYSEALDGEVSGLTIGVPRNYFFDLIDEEVESNYRAAIDVLREAGVNVREIDLPHPEQYMAIEYGLLVAEASQNHQETLRSNPDGYEEDVRALLEAGEFMLATDYIKALKGRTIIRDSWQQMFRDEQLDAVIAPTLPMPAVRFDQLEYEWPDGTVEPTINAYVRTSAPGNVTGLPAMSVPCGFSSAGLPIGMQVIGRPFDETTVFRLGQAYETRTDFTKQTASLVRS